jgi:PadR family transcriptional regulator, regulatory protein PadR
MIMLGSSKDDEYGRGFKSPGELGGVETRSAYIIVSDADAVYARAQAAGSTIVRQIRYSPYGSREFTLKDPEGHSWSVGTYDPWLPKAKTTCLLQYLELRGMLLFMAARETNPSFMNGVPELLILRLLEEQEMYGYEIVQAIRSRTDAVVSVGEGVVYPVLHGLESDGAIKSRRKTVGGRSRIYYAVTRDGSRRLAELSATWTRLSGAIGEMLTGGRHAETTG